MAGCSKADSSAAAPRVLATIGTTGSGDGEFVYPRAIDIAPDGSVLVADKTGRIQRFGAEGRFIKSWKMPEYENGKPVGMSVGPDGLLYVADTHYHRVVVFDLDGNEIRRWGRLGRGDGEFIYPTDVAFVGRGADMQVLVAEYGGNDRISVFRPDGTFIRTVGAFGMDRGQLSRPEAMAVDEARGRVYVADACNHRIAVYNLGLEIQEYWGAGGTRQGELRYPYGLALMPDGSLVVCEFGNNRLQVFDSRGESVRICGHPGREPGQLAFPWGVAVDKTGRAFVVDAGNNRVQVWRLL